MATPSDAPARPDEVERRLHPLSWLFVVLQQLRSFAIPLLLLMVTGRGNRNEWVGVLGVAGLAVAAVVRYVTFRFRLGPEGVVITSGILQRTRRDIPYERIHNVALHQSPLHRLFGVAEVRLESAGGQRPEGEMRVLALADAHAIERLIRERGAQGVAASGAPPAELAAAYPLLHLPVSEVVKLGLISNRGMVVVVATLGLLWQALPDESSPVDLMQMAFRWVRTQSAGSIPHWLLEPVGLAAIAILLLVTALVIVRALSIGLALLQFYGFRLDDVGRQLRIERGLLTRVRYHVPRRRIQAWRLSETLLHRWFVRQSLRVDSAGGAEGEGNRGTRDLAPIATPADIQRIIADVLPGPSWPPAHWRALHPKAWRRAAVVPSCALLVAAALLALRYGWPGLSPVLVLPLAIVRARLWARHSGYVDIDGELVAVREGWLNRSWKFTEVRKLQALRLTESPFDRRHGMLTLWLDTAGATAGGIIRIPYLPADEARALHARLAAGMNG